MLIESFALYTINFLPFIVPWAAGSSVAGIFLPILTNVQVCALSLPDSSHLVTPLSNRSLQ